MRTFILMAHKRRYAYLLRRGRTFKASDVSSVNLGVKDTQKSLFGVWADIFGQPVKEAKGARSDQSAG